MLELILVTVGLALVAAAVWWRRRERATAHQRLVAPLHSADPTERIAALRVIASRGISDFAPELVDLLRSEVDPAVIGALADAVARNQWEPVEAEAMVEIRLWASMFQLQSVPPDPGRGTPSVEAPAPEPDQASSLAERLAALRREIEQFHEGGPACDDPPADSSSEWGGPFEDDAEQSEALRAWEASLASEEPSRHQQVVWGSDPLGPLRVRARLAGDDLAGDVSYQERRWAS